MDCELFLYCSCDASREFYACHWFVHSISLQYESQWVNSKKNSGKFHRPMVSKSEHVCKTFPLLADGARLLRIKVVLACRSSSLIRLTGVPNYLRLHLLLVYLPTMPGEQIVSCVVEAEVANSTISFFGGQLMQILTVYTQPLSYPSLYTWYSSA
jgi:hypothetical protein